MQKWKRIYSVCRNPRIASKEIEIRSSQINGQRSHSILCKSTRMQLGLLAINLKVDHRKFTDFSNTWSEIPTNILYCKVKSIFLCKAVEKFNIYSFFSSDWKLRTGEYHFTCTHLQNIISVLYNPALAEIIHFRLWCQESFTGNIQIYYKVLTLVLSSLLIRSNGSLSLDKETEITNLI